MYNRQLKIKVCGMRDPENIRQLVAVKPDFIGFILYPESKRYVGDDYVLEAKIPNAINRVGVFVNALMSNVIHWSNRLNLDYVQLHGVEPVEYCCELLEMKIHIIKTFGIDENFEFDSLNAYSKCCDYFLFDTKSSSHGGSGLKFNWNLLTKYNINKPILLSGGIGPDDVTGILSLRDKLPLYAVDINSRFETKPGIKNVKLIKKFVKSIRKNYNLK